MIYVGRCVFYSVRNLIYYRDVIDDPAAVRGLLQRLKACKERESTDASGAQALKDIITEFMLCSLGLTIVNDPKDQVPPGVWLTAAQRECIAKVREYGYRAGLR